MKNTVCFFAFLILSSVYSFAQSKEETAILKVIEAETAAAMANDYEAWASYWAHEPFVYFNFTQKNGNWHFQGWEAVSEAMREHMEASEDNTNTNVERSNIHFHIDGNLAWVNFNQQDGLGKWEQRVLEKRNGEWKIINMTAIAHSTWE